MRCGHTTHPDGRLPAYVDAVIFPAVGPHSAHPTNHTEIYSYILPPYACKLGNNDFDRCMHAGTGPTAAVLPPYVSEILKHKQREEETERKGKRVDETVRLYWRERGVERVQSIRTNHTKTLLLAEHIQKCGNNQWRASFSAIVTYPSALRSRGLVRRSKALQLLGTRFQWLPIISRL